jgi:ABC-type multidrug transport system ATPase subunit
LWDLPPGDFFEQLIDLLKIKTFYSRDVGRLSNGERKKLMTLLAIGKQPDLLIADEATEGLDKTAKPIVLNIIEEGIKKQKFALLWISHRWDEIVRLGEVIYELSPSEQERGILKKIVPNQLSINVDLDGKIEVDDLQNDLQFSLLGTLLANEKSKDVNQININILRP